MKIKLTKEKIHSLKKELKKLKDTLDKHHKSEHDTVLFSNKEAAANDVSIGAINTRVQEIKNILRDCEEISEDIPNNKAVIGSKIEIVIDDESHIHYRLVHPIEADPMNGFIGGGKYTYLHGSSSEYGILLRTTNGGSTWYEVPILNADTIKKIKFTTGTNGWFITTIGEVFNTTDAGITWNSKATPMFSSSTGSLTYL